VNTIKSQIGRHSVALISLLVALSSLAYNTWRNEQTEENRNIRSIALFFIVITTTTRTVAIRVPVGRMR
jgi:hypothetical protein